MLSPPTLTAGIDSLAAIIGVENLLMEMINSPEKVKNAVTQIDNAYQDILVALDKVFDFKQSITRHGLYCQGSINVLQCDTAYMISNAMFKELCLPSLEFQTSLLSRVEYHLDGKGQLIHLHDICNIDKIDVIQWVPGAGETSEDS